MAFVAISSNAQHLSFMGVPMGGNLQTFIQSLKNKGLRIKYSGSHIDEDWVNMTGDFWQFNDVTILIKAPYIDKGVTSVTVQFARANRSTFSQLIQSLDKKYGKHTIERNVIGQGDTKYYWCTQSGNVEIWQTKYSKDDGKCNIEISYYDFPLVKREKEKNAARTKARANDL